VCYTCNKPGHFSRDCRQQPKALTVGTITYKKADDCSKDEDVNTAPALVNGLKGRVLYDTGCKYPVLVAARHVTPSDITQDTVLVRYANSCEERLPIAWVCIETPYVKGRVKAACVAALAFDLVLGCRYVLPQPNPATCCRATVAAVETRAQKRKRVSASKPVAVPPIAVANLLPGDLKDLQQKDPTLRTCVRRAQKGAALDETSNKAAFLLRNGILYRQVGAGDARNKQLCVPQTKRPEVLSLAHEGLFGGHMGMQKTLDRVLNVFYWPGVGSDVRRHCRSCDRCQRTSLKGNQRPVPLGRVPVVDEPFRCVAMDLVGPIQPATERGHQYILTVMDQATRYPECVPLRKVDTETIAEALWGIWSRFGTPKEILTDQGPQFMSDLMEGVNRLLSIKHHAVSVWHPCGNGMIERFNKTLKHSLKKLCAQQPKDWDRYLPAALFAYREVPQVSTGFSPFEMLYGRRVRGPMAILRHLWTDEKVEEETRSAYQYVTELRHRIETVCHQAQENIAAAHTKQERLYDRKAKARSYQPGDWVLLLLPTQHNKLQLEWQGPFEVLGAVGAHTYKVLVKAKTKIFHANLLKTYVHREEPVVVATVVYEDVDTPETTTNSLPSCPLGNKESYLDVAIGEELSPEQQTSMTSLLHQYQDIWTDVPGRTNLAEFEVNLTSNVPIQCKPYPLPHAKRSVVKQEVAGMLEMEVIEPAWPAHSSPIVPVRKKGKVKLSSVYLVDVTVTALTT
jgi:transposase InsO family protein